MIGHMHCGSALWMWVLLFLFFVRVAGQALQYAFDLPFLPEASEFQGSRLPYSALLTMQMLILGAMARTTLLVQRGHLQARRRLGRGLWWFGWIYLGGSVMRIAVGVSFPSTHPWFHSWIPMVFHLVLSGFVLQAACYHLTAAVKFDPESIRP